MTNTTKTGQDPLDKLGLTPYARAMAAAERKEQQDAEAADMAKAFDPIAAKLQQLYTPANDGQPISLGGDYVLWAHEAGEGLLSVSISEQGRELFAGFISRPGGKYHHAVHAWERGSWEAALLAA